MNATMATTTAVKMLPVSTLLDPSTAPVRRALLAMDDYV